MRRGERRSLGFDPIDYKPEGRKGGCAVVGRALGDPGMTSQEAGPLRRPEPRLGRPPPCLPPCPVCEVC